MGHKRNLAYWILGGIILLNIILILSKNNEYASTLSAANYAGLPTPMQPDYTLNLISIAGCAVLAIILGIIGKDRPVESKSKR